MKIAQVPSEIEGIFGKKISPPPGSENFAADPVAGVSRVLVTGINLFILLSAMFLLLYMLWGALDWLTSSGEKEKVQKAQNKITNAIIGFIIIFLVLAVFGVITGDILGVVKNIPGQGWSFNLPTL